jgi:peptide/nickel transport system substrate-binding protein
MKTSPLDINWRRLFRLRKRQVKKLGNNAEEVFENHLYKRFHHLRQVRGFVFAWVGLIVILIIGVFFESLSLSHYYQVLKPIPGGFFSEGVEGTFTNANPIYATSDADSTVSRLIFASLFQTNSKGQLVGDLASSYSVDTSGKIYTVHLKKDLTWQDGRPLNARDVVFTYDTIENPNAQSPLYSSWQGIEVTALNDLTVQFKLPDVLASFPYTMTNGIIPAHLLSNIAPSDLRSANFNTVDPIGAGPFVWQAIRVTNGSDPSQEQVQIALKPFSKYEGGEPKLDQFEVEVYADQNQLVNDFKNGDLTAMEAVTPPPKSVQNNPAVVKHNFILRAANMVFFKTTTGVLNDQSVRKALVEGADIPSITASLGYKTIPVNEPLLEGQLGYDPAFEQSGFNLKPAKAELYSDGWIVSKSGVRYKAGKPLSFTLTAADSPENQLVTSRLKNQWSKLGVNMTVQLLDPGDFQIALNYHDYDAVLASISIGVDPDVFVYWDSTQANASSSSGLNFSEFSDPTSDQALEGGRTRLDPALRALKYQPFLQDWQQDAPSLGLYQPRLLYLTNGNLSGIDINKLTTNSDRFYNVQNWEIREAKVTH